jgi:hypothetical protein
MALTVDDIIASERPRFRTRLVDYGDGLEFTLHTFDADSFHGIAKRIRDEAIEVSEDEYAAIAMRAISGQHFQPSPEQIAGFRAKLDKGVLQSLVMDWLRLNSGAENLADAAKKS